MMRLFFKYLKQKRRSVIACGVFALIFAVSFFLYRLPVEAVIYPALLCAVIGLFLLVFDYLRVKRKHEALTKIKTITDAMTAKRKISQSFISIWLFSLRFPLQRISFSEMKMQRTASSTGS